MNHDFPHTPSRRGRGKVSFLRQKSWAVFFLTLLLGVSVGYSQNIQFVRADASSDLQSKIDQRTSDIQALQKEIAGYQSQLNVIGTQADTLSSTLKSMDLTQKKLAADIAVSENKIAARNLQIKQLSGQISDKEGTIAEDQHIVSRSFEVLNETGNQSLPELFLGTNSISDTLYLLDQIGTLQQGLFGRIGSLHDAKTKLETNRSATQKAEADLVTLNSQLKDQRSVVLSTTAEKNALLAQTKQSESAYKQILADRQAQADALQQEINSYESQLHLSVSGSSLPPAGSGVLSWPLDAVTITQYFGNTDFSTTNPQIYSGKGHNGIDLRASIGTPVKAALSGTVVGVGNTGLIPNCYSYGKWVMIKHADGLSTLYAHLSLPVVQTGQSVSTGDLIAYSGNTGNVTGPHLHFGVYATAGVRIAAITRSAFPNSHCVGAVIPFADWTAYLNPLSYLPNL